jgi:hypothetical protein
MHEGDEITYKILAGKLQGSLGDLRIDGRLILKGPKFSA